MRDAYLAEAAKRRRVMGEESAEATVAEGDDTDSGRARQRGRAGGAGSRDQRGAVRRAGESRADAAQHHRERLRHARPRPMTTASPGGAGRACSTSPCRERRGKVVAVLLADKQDQIILVTDGGMVIRTSVRDIRIVRRNKPGRRRLQGRATASTSSRWPGSATWATTMAAKGTARPRTVTGRTGLDQWGWAEWQLSDRCRRAERERGRWPGADRDQLREPSARSHREIRRMEKQR